MCAVTDCEPWAVYRCKTRQARKEHVCGECGRTIQPGENYTHVRGLVVGDWLQYRTCRHCVAAGTWLSVMCNGYPITMLGDELYEHLGEYPSQLLDSLYAGVRDRWADGTATVPSVAVVAADAQFCLASLGGAR